MENKLKYFKPQEFVMSDEIVFDKMQSKFLYQLDRVRHQFGKPMVITSSYRTPEYNADVGGVKGSYHVKGRAIDIDLKRYTGLQRRKLIDILNSMNLTYGVSKYFLHIDNRQQPTMFGY